MCWQTGLQSIKLIVLDSQGNLSVTNKKKTNKQTNKQKKETVLDDWVRQHVSCKMNMYSNYYSHSGNYCVAAILQNGASPTNGTIPPAVWIYLGDSSFSGGA